jgi:hypothetical protein
MPNLIVSAVSTFDNKGLKKGQKEISAFDKTVKTLGKTFLGVFGAQKLLQFGKNAVNAFMADEKAAKSLELQLKNTGYAFSAPGVELYIANLQRATGILDDELRPALQTLLTASGSLTQSQRALAVALDVSAATGKSVVEVSAAMAKGFSGQTTALTRLGAGLSKATLASGDMNKILDELQTKFAGQSAARLDTYAGKMDQLSVATANATEIIGKGLLDALSAVGKDQSLDKFGKDLEDTATAISYLVGGIALLIAEMNKLGNVKVGGGSALDLILSNLPVISAYYNAGKSASMAANAPKSNFTYSLGSGAPGEIAKATEAIAIKKAAAARKEELRLLTTKNAIENKNVEELKKKFDLERIGLSAALNNATDEETKLRLRAQLAILDNNEALAKKLLAEMEAAEALKKLAEAAKIASDGLTTAFGQLAKATKDLLISFGVSPSQVGPGGTILTTDKGITGKAGLQGLSPNNPLFFTSPETTSLGLSLGFTPGIQRASATEPMDIRLTIDGGSDKLSQAIAESIQLATRSGYNTVPAGFLV